jgi:hypothetical protein
VLIEEDEGGENSEEEGDDEDEDEGCAHTPENRVEMYKEMAEEKAEKEARDKEREPKKRDYAAEQAAAIEKTRKVCRGILWTTLCFDCSYYIHYIYIYESFVLF